MHIRFYNTILWFFIIKFIKYYLSQHTYSKVIWFLPCSVCGGIVFKVKDFVCQGDNREKIGVHTVLLVFTIEDIFKRN